MKVKRSVPYLLLLLALVFVLAGCNRLANTKEDVVKVVPRNDNNKLTILSLNQLQPGEVKDLSPDGKKLIYSWGGQVKSDSARTPRNLFTLDLDTKSVHRISSSEKDQDYAIYSLDGSRIVYLEHNKDYVEGYVIKNQEYVKKALTEAENVSPYPAGWCPRELSSISWTPDSNKFAVTFACYRFANEKIFIFDKSGSKEREIDSRDYKYTSLRDPYFLNQNILLAVAGSIDKEHQPHYNVVAFDLRQKVLQPKKINYRETAEFCVSPNGKYIAYSRRVPETGLYELQVARINKNLTTTWVGATGADFIRNVAWSPDNRYVAYDDREGIWVLDVVSNVLSKGKVNIVKDQLVSNMSRIDKILWLSSREMIFSGIPRDDTDTSYIYQLKLD